LVGLLSKIHHPDSVSVELGAHVYDPAAEEHRDLDIRIDDSSGKSIHVKGIEVKAHSRPLDVTYVEQLCQKFADMPEIKDKAIASASGYTGPAKKKAAHHGVSLLILKQWEPSKETFKHVHEDFRAHFVQRSPRWVVGPHVAFNPREEVEATIRSTFSMATPVVGAEGAAIPGCENLDALSRKISEKAALIASGNVVFTDPANPTIVDVIIKLTDPILAVIPDTEIRLKEAKVRGSFRLETTNLAPSFKVLVQDDDESPLVSCAIAELTTGDLIGLSFARDHRQIRLVRIVVNDRNRKKICGLHL
jgi:hypothetical protein